MRNGSVDRVKQDVTYEFPLYLSWPLQVLWATAWSVGLAHRDDIQEMT